MCCDGNNPLDEYDDDCYEFDVIDEQVYECEFYEFDIDDYWARAWVINEEGFYRADSDVYNDREYRVFPTRYRLKDFVFTKSLRRILNKNRDLTTVIREFRPTEGKDDLITHHRQTRFQSESPRHSLRNSYQYLKYSNVGLMETCVFKGDKLVACSIFFVGERSVVSSIGFWDPNEITRSLGILTVLLEIRYALENGKEFYYLGDLIRQDPNYQYKTRFPGLELWDWDNESWADYRKEPERIKAMFDHKFRCKDDLDKDPEFTVSLLLSASRNHPDIVASALVGSRAHGTEHEDSKYELIVLTDNIPAFFKDDVWVKRFHRWRESKTEDFGPGKTLRAFYKNGDVFEFNFVPPSWAQTVPLDAEARRVVEDGMKILHDPNGILEKLQKAVASKGKSKKRR